ncbi:MAG: sortase [Bacilli bacterium]|nr:sortase [Bacilli bacterium]
MQILNQEKLKNKRRLKKSQILLLGSFLVFIGIILLSWNYIITLKDEVYSDMRVEIVMGDEDSLSIITVPVSKNLNTDSTYVEEYPELEEVIDYSKYVGVLEIPKIGLKRGFYGSDNRYNNIQYNVAVIRGSEFPDVDRGNLILMAHSGNAYISYFRYLYKLELGDMAYVTFKGKKYTYTLVNTYDVPKVGQAKIIRNFDKTTLTLITCTHNSDDYQSIYILEQV